MHSTKRLCRILAVLGVATSVITIVFALHVTRQKESNLEAIAAAISVYLAQSNQSSSRKAIVLVPYRYPNEQSVYSRFMVGFASYSEDLCLVTSAADSSQFDSRWKILTRDEVHAEDVSGFRLFYPKFHSSDRATVIADDYRRKFTLTLYKDRNFGWIVTDADIGASDYGCCCY